MHFLILGARAPACLEWARAIQSQGWKVTIADSLLWPMSKFSAAGKNFVRLPEPRQNTQQWLDAIQTIVIQKKIDWVIPTCEEVFYLAWGAEQLNPFCRLFTGDFNLLKHLHHKGMFADMTRNWCIQAPESFLINNRTELNLFLDRSKNFVFKPAYSRFAAQTLICPDQIQLDLILPTIESPWIAQQFIQGKEHCSFSVIQNGQAIAHSCYHPKYRVGKGSGIYFEVTHSPEILEFIKQFARETAYTGQVGFDFIESNNGKIYVLECNPRATSGVHLFNDQPQALTHIFHRAEPSLYQPTSKPRMSSMAMILFAMKKQGWKKEFWQDLNRAEDIISHTGEHKPHYAQLLCLVEMLARAFRYRKGLLAAVTSDIEWDGQAIQGTPICEK